MKRRANHDTGVYKYLQSLGVLDEAPETVARYKKIYWNQVKRQWKIDRAKAEKSFTVSFTPSELKALSAAAAMHELSRTRFIKQACLAYVHKRYLVPDSRAMGDIRAMLSLTYSALQDLYESDKVPALLGIEVLLRMESLERTLLHELTHPKSESNDH